jgi:hypothetical protein
MRGSRIKIHSKKSRPYIYCICVYIYTYTYTHTHTHDVKFLALLGAPYIYISRLRDKARRIFGCESHVIRRLWVAVRTTPRDGIVYTNHSAEMDRRLYIRKQQAVKDHQDGNVTRVSGMKTTSPPTRR